MFSAVDVKQSLSVMSNSDATQCDWQLNMSRLLLYSRLWISLKPRLWPLLVLFKASMTEQLISPSAEDKESVFYCSEIIGQQMITQRVVLCTETFLMSNLMFLSMRTVRSSEKVFIWVLHHEINFHRLTVCQLRFLITYIQDLMFTSGSVPNTKQLRVSRLKFKHTNVFFSFDCVTVYERI